MTVCCHLPLYKQIVACVVHIVIEWKEGFTWGGNYVCSLNYLKDTQQVKQSAQNGIEGTEKNHLT